MPGPEICVSHTVGFFHELATPATSATSQGNFVSQAGVSHMGLIGVPGHRILREHEAAVAKVLTNPYRIVRDVLYENRECFYRQRTHPDYPELLLKVCVEFEPEDTGAVITAFLTPSVRADEVQRWP